MKGRVYKRGNVWYYRFDADTDPLTGKRQQVNGSGFRTEREAWKECRAAMADYEKGRVVKTTKRKVGPALGEWLTRIEHSIKPSMAYRCYRMHAEDDPLLGQPVESGKPFRQSAKNSDRTPVNPGLKPKTVVNTHRMLHRAWEDFEAWGWAKRNVVSDAHPPRVPREGRKVWTVSQLQTFLQRSRHDRFFALWVLEVTSGMRRCELAGANRNLLDLDAGTLDIGPTRVVVDGKVIVSDGKTENAQHMLALDPFTLAVLGAHVGMLDQERKDLGPDYHDDGWLFCWENGKPPHPDTITRRFKRLAKAAGLPEIDLHDVRHSYATAGRNAKIDWKALSKRIGHADVAFTMKQYVQTDLEADREVANILADLIIGGLLVTGEVDGQAD